MHKLGACLRMRQKKGPKGKGSHSGYNHMDWEWRARIVQKVWSGQPYMTGAVNWLRGLKKQYSLWLTWEWKGGTWFHCGLPPSSAKSFHRKNTAGEQWGQCLQALDELFCAWTCSKFRSGRWPENLSIWRLGTFRYRMLASVIIFGALALFFLPTIFICYLNILSTMYMFHTSTGRAMLNKQVCFRFNVLSICSSECFIQ